MWVVDTPVQWYRFFFEKYRRMLWYEGAKERWEKGDVPDDAMSIMNSDLPLPRVHFGGKYFGFSETEEFECYLNSSRNRTMQQQVAFIAPNFPV